MSKKKTIRRKNDRIAIKSQLYQEDFIYQLCDALFMMWVIAQDGAEREESARMLNMADILYGWEPKQYRENKPPNPKVYGISPLSGLVNNNKLEPTTP